MQKRMDRVKKIHRKKWILRGLAIIFLLIFGAGIYYGAQVWAAISNSSGKQLALSKLRTNQADIKKDPFTVLLIGADQRGNDPDWRSDVMILVAVNPKTKSAKVMSIPRDLYVTIPNTNGKKGKINWSGPYACLPQLPCNNLDMRFENIRRAVENLVQVPVDYYAKLNFDGFQEVVDAVGGVDVNVKFPFHQEMIGGKMAYFEPGNHHLNGAEALAYVRMRHQDPNGDLGRNERQREVLKGLFDKIASFEGVFNFDKVMKAVGNNLIMSFKPSEIPGLIDLYRQIPKENIQTVEMKVSFAKIRGIGDVDIISKAEKERIRKIFQDELDYHPKAEKLQGVPTVDTSQTVNPLPDVSQNRVKRRGHLLKKGN
jgi:LCP family protein required for cell wall assembly